MRNNPEEFSFSGKAAVDNLFPVKNTRHNAGNENTYALFCSYSSFNRTSKLHDEQNISCLRIRLFERKRVSRIYPILPEASGNSQ